MAVLVHSSAAFLTAYSAQLQVLTLSVYSVGATGRLMASVLQCSQLRSLTVCSSLYQLQGNIPEHYVDVAQLDEAVTQLTALRLEGLYFTVQAVTQFLTQCPAVRDCKLRQVRMHLPDVLELAGGRRVWVDHK